MEKIAEYLVEENANEGVNEKEIKVEEINEMLQNMLTLASILNFYS